MRDLQPLTADDAGAVLAFELANRAWFARTIFDRGDAYFAEFDQRYDDLLSEQATGVCAFYLLVDEGGSVVGRFNLYDIAEGCADVGYRVAEEVTGRGVATAALRQLCRLAVDDHGLRALTAAVADRNLASQRVLVKAGFAPVGPADPASIGGKPGTLYRRDLTGSSSPLVEVRAKRASKPPER